MDSFLADLIECCLTIPIQIWCNGVAVFVSNSAQLSYLEVDDAHMPVGQTIRDSRQGKREVMRCAGKMNRECDFCPGRAGMRGGGLAKRNQTIESVSA